MKNPPKPTERHLQIARDVMLNGKSFRQAAKDAGFSQGVADTGQKQYRKNCRGMNQAFLEAAIESNWMPATKKAIATHRLVQTALDDHNPRNVQAAELIGRMKDVDMFARTGDAQVGVFAAIFEQGALEELEQLVPPSEGDHDSD